MAQERDRDMQFARDRARREDQVDVFNDRHRRGLAPASYRDDASWWPSFGRRYFFGNPETSIRPFSVGNMIDNVMDSFYRDPFFSDFRSRASDFDRALAPVAVNPRWDVRDNDTSYVVHAELPGMDKNDVKVNISNGVMYLSGEARKNDTVQGDNYIVKERSMGKFERSFTLPDSVREEDISANFKNGVLEIILPKEAGDRPGTRSIKID